MDRGFPPAAAPTARVTALLGGIGAARRAFVAIGLAIGLAIALTPVLAAMSAAPARADSPAPAAPRQGATLDLRQCVSRQRADDDPAALLASPRRFDCATRSSRLGQGDFWLRLTPPHPSRLADIAFMPQWQRDSTLYARHTDGSMAMLRLDNRALWNLAHLGARVQFAVPGDGAPVDALLLRIDGAVNQTGLIDAPMLLGLEASTARERAEAVIYSLFAGLGIGLCAYNFILWLTIRERFQLVYCATLLSMVAYGWAHSGGICLTWRDGNFVTALKVNYYAMAAVAMLVPRFFIDFLEPGTVSPGLRRLTWLQIAAMSAVCVTIALFPPAWVHLLDRLYVAAFLPVPALAVAIAWQAFRRGSRAVGVLVLAWTAPVVMLAVRLLHALNLIPYSAFIEHSPVLAMGLEALMGSLAVASRVKLIAHERDTARAEERMARRLADIDPLTGLLNRRALLDRTLGWRCAEPLRLCLVDVDHFKAVNDRHGHDIGDAVLRELGAVLSARAGPRAIIGRMGGEEFALVGRATDLSPAVALGILSDVRAHSFSGGLHITVSIGMAEGIVSDEEQWLAVYRRADAALYAAKGSGRNRANQSEAAVASFAEMPRRHDDRDVTHAPPAPRSTNAA